jgi:ABC-2 type transport system permease protein
MKSFRGFIIKELYHIFRDRRTMLILFGMPIVQLVLFGFAIRNELNDAHIAVLDYAKDEASEAVVNKLLSSGYFLLAENIHSEHDIEPAFKRGIVKEVLIIAPDFARQLTEGKAALRIVTDATDPNTARMLISYTSAIVDGFVRSRALPTDAVTIIPETKMLYNPELKSVYVFVPGLISLILMLVSALMTSITITREKELGTMEILLVSPLKPAQIIIGKVLPYLVLSFINVITILLLAHYMFGVPFRGSLVLFLGEALLFIVTALSLGILISTVSSTQQAAMMISLGGLMLPTILLSGFVFPVENMPVPLQVVSTIIPARWFVRITRGIMLKGVGLEYLWRETLILFGMMLLLLAVSVKKFKVRLE